MDDPWRLLTALADSEGGEIRLYEGDVDALPDGVMPRIRRETIITGSRPGGYQVIVISVPDHAGGE